jgi:hypothetical protein
VIRYDSKETRDTVIRSGLESGVAAGYDHIDELLDAPLRKAG